MSNALLHGTLLYPLVSFGDKLSRYCTLNRGNHLNGIIPGYNVVKSGLGGYLSGTAFKATLITWASVRPRWA